MRRMIRVSDGVAEMLRSLRMVWAETSNPGGQILPPSPGEGARRC